MFLRGEVAKVSKLSEVSECWKNISLETTIMGLSQEWAMGKVREGGELFYAYRKT